MSRQDDERVLGAILKDFGEVTPEIVVKAASAESHPWHNRLTWDNEKAAHAHRLDQARALIRSVNYDIVLTSRVVSCPAYVRDPQRDVNEQGYVSIRTIRPKSEQARAVLEGEFERVRAALARAQAIAHVLQLEDQVREMVEMADFVSTLLVAGPPHVGQVMRGRRGPRQRAN